MEMQQVDMLLYSIMQRLILFITALVLQGPPAGAVVRACAYQERAWVSVKYMNWSTCVRVCADLKHTLC